MATEPSEELPRVKMLGCSVPLVISPRNLQAMVGQTCPVRLENGDQPFGDGTVVAASQENGYVVLEVELPEGMRHLLSDHLLGSMVSFSAPPNPYLS